MIRNSSTSSCKVTVGFVGRKTKLELDNLALKLRNVGIFRSPLNCFYSCYIRTDMAQTKGVLLQLLIAKAPQGGWGCLLHRLAERGSCISWVSPCQLPRSRNYKRGRIRGTIQSMVGAHSPRWWCSGTRLSGCIPSRSRKPEPSGSCRSNRASRSRRRLSSGWCRTSSTNCLLADSTSIVCPRDASGPFRASDTSIQAVRT